MPTFPARRTSLARFAAALAITLPLVSCSGDGPTGPDNPVVASISVTPGADTLVTLGRTRQFAGVAREADGTPIPGAVITWSSSNTAVATVHPTSGLATAIASGTAEIRATVGSVIGTGEMAVVQFVAGVTITPGIAAQTTIGATTPFTAVAKDSSNATVPGVRFLWLTSDPDIATVDTVGVARATGPGVVTIIASGRGTPGYAEYTVTQLATQLAFSINPTNASAGAAINPAIQVEIRDAGGNLVRDARNAVTLAFGTNTVGGTLAGSRTVNAVGGIATFSGIWVDKIAANYTLKATAGGMSDAVSPAFAITAGPVTRLEANVSGSGFEAGWTSPEGLIVTFWDAQGNPAPPIPTTINLRSATRLATFYYGTAVDNPVGRGYPNLGITRPGTGYRIEVTAGSLSVETAPFNVKASFTSIAVGGSQTCGITPGGTFCWGYNGNGLLGRGTNSGTEPRDSLPGWVPFFTALTQIDASVIATCGLSANGTAYCWGEGVLSPTAVPNTGPGGVVLTSITVGWYFKCGLTAGGAAYCWGDGTYGQLGAGLGVSSPTPLLATGSGGPSMIFTKLVAGDEHVCGVTTLNTAYCWGRGDFGIIGDGTPNHRGQPTLVSGSGSGSRAFVAIAAGNRHSCGITAAKQISCWGLNTSGQLGTGAFDTGQQLPTLQAGVPGGTFFGISAGGNHTCIATSFGTSCWGSNTYGELGAGNVPDRSNPTFIVWPYAPQAVWAGANSTCATESTVGVYCWGRNLDGELGIGTMSVAFSLFPVRVAH